MNCINQSINPPMKITYPPQISKINQLSFVHRFLSNQSLSPTSYCLFLIRISRVGIGDNQPCYKTGHGHSCQNRNSQNNGCIDKSTQNLTKNSSGVNSGGGDGIGIG
mmetsp:Transcript_5871/g.8613  ORF Transcript_5871/g.8613 Transcript_5871/m.8613 type:complete len:107 (-) Transcript_5871:296-616(-)